jgi:riboflavin biosynthesis pyrimidine reductase
LPENQGRLNLAEVMKFLAGQEINEVLIEAGENLVKIYEYQECCNVLKLRT